jgi:hypothetical protein
MPSGAGGGGDVTRNPENTRLDGKDSEFTKAMMIEG